MLMSEVKDPSIKLFGKTIPLTESPPPPPLLEKILNEAGEGLDCDEAPTCEKQIDTKLDDDISHTFTSLESTDPNETTLRADNKKISASDNEAPTSETSKTEEEQGETLKKPDKIILCPRCNSMDTKFCYYNNYNVSQPRHFCKKCQRYWTAGGITRNVPIGAGRRKNKNSVPHYRHITVSDAVYNAQGNMSQDCVSNGFRKPDNLKSLVPREHGENSGDQTSPVTVSNVKSENGKNGHNDVMMQDCYGFLPQVPFFAGPPWPYLAQWVPQPGVFPPGYPMPFYSAPPYRGPWIAPWVTPPLSTSPNSPTLGKHSRDKNSSKQNEHEEEGEKRETGSERSLWIPKTLRIDDPGEAAKSSIWATLGIKLGKSDFGPFKAFQSKANGRSDNSDTSPVLHANPAALSRSRSFQEGS